MGSRFTSATESRYASVEGEALAVAEALEKARYFVLGCNDLVIAVDHKPLLKIFGDRSLENIPNARLRNLKEKTLRYKFKMLYVPVLKITPLMPCHVTQVVMQKPLCKLTKLHTFRGIHLTVTFCAFPNSHIHLMILIPVILFVMTLTRQHFTLQPLTQSQTCNVLHGIKFALPPQETSICIA